jgi:hypothetical protein
MIGSLRAVSHRAPPPVGQTALLRALHVWERRLLLESLKIWLLRGTIAALITIVVVLLVGWFAPIPEADLRPIAAQLAVIPLLAATLVGLFPRRHIRKAAELDTRLAFGDRLATAWAFRASEQPIVRLQRADTLSRLGQRSPSRELLWRPSRIELIALGAAALITLLLLMTPSPQQAVLDQQQADLIAVQQANQRLDTMRQAAAADANLTPDQVRQLDELLQRAQAELNSSRTPQEARAVLAQTQAAVSQQLGDPNADLRDEALAAMSETLAAEPQTQALGNALQREDPRAASQALSDLSAGADRLSDVERQSLSRALQRAANVGRADQRTSSALRDAAQALANGASAQNALSQADAALRDSIQASQSQAAVNATVQQLRDMQTRMAAGQPLASPDDQSAAQQSSSDAANGDLPSGVPLALDPSGGQTQTDPTSGETARGAGTSPAAGGYSGQPAPSTQPAENVFVPGRPGNGPSDQDLVDQPFTIRGAPRPYRDVLNQYAQTSRDYVDRPDISPAVRDLVKQYFQELEADQ